MLDIDLLAYRFSYKLPEQYLRNGFWTAALC